MLIDGAELTESVAKVLLVVTHGSLNVTYVRHNPSDDFQFPSLGLCFLPVSSSRMPFNCKLLDKEPSFGSLKSLR